MKRKLILFFVTVSMIICALAISVSATAIGKDTTVTLDGSFTDVNGATVTEINLYDADGDALIWYLDTNGKLVSAKIASVVTVDGEGVISFTDKTIFKDKNTAKSVIAVNLRDNVKVSGTEINWDGQIKHFDSTKGVNEDTSFASSGFQFGTYGGSGYTIQYFYFPTSTKTMVKRMFQNSAIKVADFEPGTPLEKMGIVSFYNATKLQSIFIPNDLEVITSAVQAGMFQGCSSLSSVTFEENSRLWDAGHNTFYGCTSLKELYLPNSVITIGSEFARSSGIKIFSFGAGFRYVTRRDPAKDPDNSHIWVFYGTRIEKIYMPASFALLNDEYNFDDYSEKDERLDTFDRIFSDAGSFTLFFTGTQEEMEALKTRFSYTQENQSMVSALKKIYSYEEYVAAGSPSGACAVYGYSQCDAFYNGAHENTTVVEYDGFHKEGKKIEGCAICNQGETTVLPALFTCRGYSVQTFGSGSGIALGYTVNAKAVSDYTELTGAALTYGVFAVGKDKLCGNDIFAENGTPASGVISAEIFNKEFVAFELAIVGFTDEFKDNKLAMGAYVKVTNGDTVEYSYMQDDTTGELSGKYYFASYNDVVGAE